MSEQRYPQCSDFIENMRWLEEHRTAYAGQWVALRRGDLVAAAGSLRELLDAVQGEQSDDRPFVVRVESENDNRNSENSVSETRRVR